MIHFQPLVRTTLPDLAALPLSEDNLLVRLLLLVYDICRLDSLSGFPVGFTQWAPRELYNSVLKPVRMSPASFALSAVAAERWIHNPSGPADTV